MRIATGGFWHETHTFSNVLTTLDDFKSYWLQEGQQIPQQMGGTRTTMGGFIDGCCQLGWELVFAINAGAMPSGLVTRPTYELLEMRLLDLIGGAGRLDGLLISLHGAMVAEGLDDAEGRFLTRLREAVGPDMPIVATLDLHANISPLMAEKANVLVGYDTYPHVDAYERSVEAVQILQGMLNGSIRPAVALSKPPLLPVPQGMYTALPPMRDLIERAHQIEHDPRVVTVTVSGGFPYSDIPKAGMGFVVTTNNDQALAQMYAEELGGMAWERRQGFFARNMPVKQAVQEAMAFRNGPVVLVDVADNIGGGSPGDGTVLLQELLRARARGAVVVIADAQAVRQAAAAGIGAELRLEVGGKTDDRHGPPVPITGRVRLLSDGAYAHQGPHMKGQMAHMGLTAVLDCAGLTLVLTERKSPPFDAQQLLSLGINPANQQILVVKAAIAWRAAFGDVATKVIDVDTPGLCSANLASFSYQHLVRPIYPLDPF